MIIVEANDRHFYIVKEPQLAQDGVALHSELTEAIYYSFRSSGKLGQIAELNNLIWKASEDLEIIEKVKISY